MVEQTEIQLLEEILKTCGTNRMSGIKFTGITYEICQGNQIRQRKFPIREILQESGTYDHLQLEITLRTNNVTPRKIQGLRLSQWIGYVDSKPVHYFGTIDYEIRHSITFQPASGSPLTVHVDPKLYYPVDNLGRILRPQFDYKIWPNRTYSFMQGRIYTDQDEETHFVYEPKLENSLFLVFHTLHSTPGYNIDQLIEAGKNGLYENSLYHAILHHDECSIHTATIIDAEQIAKQNNCRPEELLGQYYTFLSNHNIWPGVTAQTYSDNSF